MSYIGSNHSEIEIARQNQNYFLITDINTFKKCTAVQFKHLQPGLLSYRTPIS